MDKNNKDDLPLLAYARSTDPETSQDAAKELKVTRLMRLVLLVLEVGDVDDQGMNWQQVSEHPIMKRNNVDRQSVSPRFKPLRKAGYIETLQRRVKGYKKAQQCHRITDAGRAALKRMIKPEEEKE